MRGRSRSIRMVVEFDPMAAAAVEVAAGGAEAAVEEEAAAAEAAVPISTAA